MVVALDHGVVMGDDDLVSPDDGADGRSIRHRDILDAPPDDAASTLHAVGDGLSVISLADSGAGPGVATETAAGVRVSERLPATVRVIDPIARPRAADMLPLALADLRGGLALAPEAASPLYVRDKVALTAAEQLARRAVR